MFFLGSHDIKFSHIFVSTSSWSIYRQRSWSLVNSKDELKLMLKPEVDLFHSSQ